MKKIIIAMLLILPLIIVATVLLSADIISHNVYIAVDSVELNYKEDTLIVQLEEEEVQLVANVYPMAARNKDVYWEIENYQSFGEDMENAVTISDNGLVKFYTYCAFDAVVTTKEGYKTDRINIIVESGKAKKVEFDMDSYVLECGEIKELLYKTMPIDGEITDTQFVSDNTDVLEITANGVLMAKKQGSANITVTLNNDSKITATKRFTVSEGVSFYGRDFYVSKDIVSLTNLGITKTITAVTGGSIRDGILTFTAEKAILELGSDTITIRKCGANEIAVQTAEILATKLIKLGTDSIRLKAIWKDVTKSGYPEVSFDTDNEKIATINSDGEITPIKRGIVTFTVTSGGNDAEITMEIINAIKYFRLNTSDTDDKRGILNDSVIPTKQISGGNIVKNKIELDFNYPKEAEWEDFEITVSDEDVATVDGNIIVFNDISDKTTLIVTVKAKHSAYKNRTVSVRRTFKMVNAVNCKSYSDLEIAAEAKENISLGSNITYEKGAQSLKVDSYIYGNGFILDATKMDKPIPQTPVFNMIGSDVFVSNIVIRCDDAIKMNDPNGMQGVPLIIGEKEQNFRSKARVEYSVLGNAFWGMEAHNSDIEIEGCIVRNISNMGIQFASSYNEAMENKSSYCNVIMTNNIISNVIAPAISSTTVESMPDGSAIPEQGKIHIKGFLDIYNWQDLTSANMLDRSITGNEALDGMLSKILKSAIAKELQKDDYKQYVITDGKKYYIHLGIITAGGLHKNTTEIIIDDERFVCMPLTAVEQANGILDAVNVKRFDPLNMYLYENTADIDETSDYTEDKWLYKKLRGEE